MTEPIIAAVVLGFLWFSYMAFDAIKDESELAAIVAVFGRPLVWLIALYFVIRIIHWSWENPIPFLDRIPFLNRI